MARLSNRPLHVLLALAIGASAHDAAAQNAPTGQRGDGPADRDRFPAWQGNLLTGSVIRGRVNGATGIERVVFNDQMWEVRHETILPELKQRIRDVRQGPDGLIYVLTEEVDGAVLRVEPL